MLAKSLSDKKSSGQSVDEELVTSVNKKVELLQNIIDQDKDHSRIYPKDADRAFTNDFLGKYIQTNNLSEKFVIDRYGFYVPNNPHIKDEEIVHICKIINKGIK